jgi:hypothetical protein
MALSQYAVFLSQIFVFLNGFTSAALSLPVASNPEGMQMSIDMVIRNKIVFPAS